MALALVLTLIVALRLVLTLNLVLGSVFGFRLAMILVAVRKALVELVPQGVERLLIVQVDEGGLGAGRVVG